MVTACFVESALCKTSYGICSFSSFRFVDDALFLVLFQRRQEELERRARDLERREQELRNAPYNGRNELA